MDCRCRQFDIKLPNKKKRKEIKNNNFTFDI